MTDGEQAAVTWVPAAHLAEEAVSSALEGAPVRTHDAKALMRSTLKLGIDLRNLQLDTAIAAYLLDPAEARYELPHLVERYTRFALEPDAPAAKGQLDLDGSQADPDDRRRAPGARRPPARRADAHQPRRAGHGRPLPRHRDPAGARAGADGARRHRRRRGRPAGAEPAPDRRRPAHRARAQGGRRARRPEHQLARAAARDPVRRAAGRARADADQAHEDRSVDRRRHAGEAARRVARVHRPAAAVPRGREAAAAPTARG